MKTPDAMWQAAIDVCGMSCVEEGSDRCSTRKRDIKALQEAAFSYQHLKKEEKVSEFVNWLSANVDEIAAIQGRSKGDVYDAIDALVLLIDKGEDDESN